MKKKTVLLLLLIVVVAVGGYFLWKGETTKSNKIKVGVILPLTGDAAVYGKSLKNGLDIAVNEKNIELIYEDSKGDPKTAVNSMNKLISIDKVQMVIGDMFTNTTLAINPIADRNGILLLTPTASFSEISEKSRTTFRLYPSEKEEANLLFSFYQKNLKDERSAILVVNEDAMLKVANIINKCKDKQVIEYSKGVTDFKPILSKLNKDIKILFVIGYFEESSLIIKQSVETKRDFTFIGLSTLYTPQLDAFLGNIRSDIYLSAPYFSLDSTSVYIKEFEKEYLAKFNKNPDIWSGYGYDAGKIVERLIINSQKNRTDFISEMYNIKNFNGITGEITINKDRSISKAMNVIKYIDGHFEPTK